MAHVCPLPSARGANGNKELNIHLKVPAWIGSQFLNQGILFNIPENYLANAQLQVYREGITRHILTHTL